MSPFISEYKVKSLQSGDVDKLRQQEEEAERQMRAEAAELEAYRQSLAQLRVGLFHHMKNLEPRAPTPPKRMTLDGRAFANLQAALSSIVLCDPSSGTYPKPKMMTPVAVLHYPGGTFDERLFAR